MRLPLRRKSALLALIALLLLQFEAGWALPTCDVTMGSSTAHVAASGHDHGATEASEERGRSSPAECPLVAQGASACSGGAPLPCLSVVAEEPALLGVPAIPTPPGLSERLVVSSLLRPPRV
ncbi:MAG: hypothetical protein WD766_07525 [Gemmatimonadota bacterium]